ncbi:hypothetical protein SAMN04488040_3117 [Sulfitobacter marinus]|uniref:Uncharacterized protein n=1 Tax=Sulfitobacter marinus TaxID=394264 RepID=A0A1I6V6B0_9RHOB|nr:hypothetical protein [Sulfitobacter marinus]SFT09154.1 hypothetical protein SAMN04488040_3117 [Sulfitobacter marinus]
MNSDFLINNSTSEDAQVARDVDAFAYFVDPAELSLLVPGWPAEMRLLVCMDAAELCEFVVFHDEEEDAVFERVAEILDRPVGSFAVSPDVAGQPQRRLMFSEENALLKAIQGSEDLKEIAADYLINYNFALEEGLDFDALMRPRQVAEDDPALRVTTDKIFPLASKGTRKKRKAPSGLPEGYASAEEAAPEECFYLGLEMWPAGGRIRIAENRDQALPMVPSLAREVAFRDDFSSVYIPRNILPGHWRPEDQMVIDIPAELFPAGFSDNCGHRKVTVAVMPRGVFIEFGAHVVASDVADRTADAGDVVAALPQQSGRKLSLRNLYIPLVAVAGLSVTGLYSTIIAQTTATEVATKQSKSAFYGKMPQSKP